MMNVYTQGRLVQGLHVMKLVWDFTESNFFTFVVPNTLFGIFSATSQQYVIDGPTQHPDALTQLMAVLWRFPLVVLFNWSNVFVFDLANQKLPQSVLEDYINKPWRPLPTGKITSDQTRLLTIMAIPTVLLLNSYLGVWQETAILLLLTWIYNDLRGGDEVFRDLIIAVAYAFYNKGSLQVALGAGSDIDGAALTNISPLGYGWISIVSLIIMTTMSVQDLKDQKGDAARKRKTLPLWLGDGASRWVIASFIPFWSIICCVFWYTGLLGIVTITSIGLYTAWRTLRWRDEKSDAKTWKCWCAWLAVIYALPVVKCLG